MIGDVVIRCEGLSRSYGSGENEVHALSDAALEACARDVRHSDRSGGVQPPLPYGRVMISSR
jgi:hypothetical protein